DEQNQPVKPGEIGELQINGPTCAPYYWNNRVKTHATFLGEWTRSGDKYTVDADGYYTYAGRTDDMLKVSGMYVSPFEVETALGSHPAVLEAARLGPARAAGRGQTQAHPRVTARQRGVAGRLAE